MKDLMDEKRFRKEDGLCDVKVNIHQSPGERGTNKCQAECTPPHTLFLFLEGNFYFVLRIEPQSSTDDQKR